MYLVSCTNAHHDVTDCVNHGMFKNTKTWVSWERNIIFLWNKKILNPYLRWHILRSYNVVAEVTFKQTFPYISMICWYNFLSSGILLIAVGIKNIGLEAECDNLVNLINERNCKHSSVISFRTITISVISVNLLCCYAGYRWLCSNFCSYSFSLFKNRTKFFINILPCAFNIFYHTWCIVISFDDINSTPCKRLVIRASGCKSL